MMYLSFFCMMYQVYLFILVVHIQVDTGSLAKGINFKKSKKFSGDATCPPSLLDSRALL